jgi:SAM-dependent methyltransferase
VHQNPRPGVEALNAFYSQSGYHAPIVETRENHLKFARWYYSEKVAYSIERSGIAQGRVFDIGCGMGGVLKLYEERGWEALGVEPDPLHAQFAIGEFGLQGVRQGILDANLRLDQKVDLVFSNHAFEHFADLGQVMEGVRQIIKPGGCLFTVVPTYMSNKSSLSKRWMNSAHYSLFTHRSLNNLLARYGFEEVVHTYAGWKKEHDDLWHMARFTGKPLDPAPHFENPKQVSRYLHVTNPVRSSVFYPLYSHWPTRVRAWTRFRDLLRLLTQSPGEFAQKAYHHLGRLMGRSV